MALKNSSRKTPSLLGFVILPVILTSALATGVFFTPLPAIASAFIAATAVMALGYYLYTIFYRIEADPPHVALVQHWGELTEAVKKDGWRIFPFKGVWWDFVEIDVSQKDKDFDDIPILTPDRAKSRGTLSFTFTPSEDGKDLVRYVRIGKEKGFLMQLEQIVDSRLREWGLSEEEGPDDWYSLQKSREEATLILILRIASLKGVLAENRDRDDLERIRRTLGSPSIASLYKHFYGGPQNAKERRIWGAPDSNSMHLGGWQELDNRINRLSGSDQDRLEVLMRLVFESLEAARQGRVDIRLEAYGIHLNRITLGSIEVSEEIQTAAERRAKEAEDKAAEKVELQHVSDRIAELSARFKEMGVNSSDAMQTARLVVQVERNKITEAVQRYAIEMDDTTRDALRNLSPTAAAALAAYFQSGRGNGKTGGGGRK